MDGWKLKREITMTTNAFLQELDLIANDPNTTKPHKLIAVLAVLVGIKQGKFKENRFFFDTTFRELFSALFAKYAAPGDRDRPLNPFFHLRSSNFWKLAPVPGMESALPRADSIGGVGALNRIVAYAYLDNQLHKDLTELKQVDNVVETVETILDRWVKSRDSVPKLEAESGVTTAGDVSRFPHEAQSLNAICGLLRSLGLGGYVAAFEVYDKQTNDYYECDLIVVCAFGVFVTELKHWTGRIQVAPRSWLINGSQHRPDPHASNRFKCKVLRGIYRHSFNTFPDLWFESVVVLTNPVAEVTNDSPTKTDQHNPTFASINRFIDFLRYRQTQATGPLLNSEQIKAVVAKFENLRVRDHVKGYCFPGYEVVERLTQREDLVELIVRPTEGRRRNLQRFRAFCPPINVKPDDRASFLRKANNTLDALAKAGEHPNLLRVWNVPNEFGHVIEGSEWSEEGTLADLLDRSPAGCLGNRHCRWCGEFWRAW